MKVLRRSWRLARLAACTALALGLAGTAGALSAPAQARVTATLTRYHLVASWGANGNAELGDGTTISRWRYGDVRTSNDLTQVAAGLVHALAVRSDGTVWAGGLNAWGELGDGSTTDRSEPVQVAGLTGITQVAAGAFFSLALRSDGMVWAWGDNRNGQLGRKTVTDHEVTPARVAVLNHVTKISAGNDFALALRSDGIVFAWGHGQRGQLGNGTTADSPVPVKIAGLSPGDRDRGGLGGLARDGEQRRLRPHLGVGLGRQRGRGARRRHAGRPRYPRAGDRAPGVHRGPVRRRRVRRGPGHRRLGLGLGRERNRRAGRRPAYPAVTRPVNAIAAGSGITQLAAGVSHMLALKSDGTVLSWGWNQSGQLGRDPAGQASAGPGPVTGLAGATQVSAG